MVRIPGADGAGPPGRADRGQSPRAGTLQKNGIPETGKSPLAGDINRAARSSPVQTTVKTNALPAGTPTLGFQAKNLTALARSLGLPGDALSVAILSFARRFSLPLNPGLLAQIRRAGLSAVPGEARQGKALSPQDREARNAAAFAAAAAAASKGLELSREGLAAYARYLSGQWAAEPGNRPGEQAGPEGGSGGGGSGDKPGPDSGSGGGGPDGGNSGNGSKAGPEGGSGNGDGSGSGGEQAGPEGGKAGDPARPDTLRERALGVEPPLLGFLNRAPGRNGERWIVLPFAFTNNNLDYRVVLRILIDEPLSNDSPGRLDLDISGGGLDNPVFRWFFMYDKMPGETFRLQARFWPPEGKKSLISLQKELSRLLGLHPERIELRNNDEKLLFVMDCGDTILPSINEEV